MFYRSKNGRHQVEVAPDGAIRVKPGDWLSKYSAAIHNNYWTIHEFARKDRSGRFLPIANPNLIYAGETVYHLPTYHAHRKATPRAAVITFDTPLEITAYRVAPLSEAEKKKKIAEHLEGEFHLRGENFEFVEKLAHYTHTASEMGEIGECLASIFVHVPEAVETAVEGFSVVGALAFSVFAAIKVINAWEFGQRLTGLRAVAYGMTAWAFGDARPAPPAWIRANISPASAQRAMAANAGDRQFVGYVREAVQREEQQVLAHQRAWNDSCQAAWNNMDEMVAKQHVRKEYLQTLFRVLGDGDRNTLVQKLMNQLAEKHLRKGFEQDAFWSPAPNYPN
ncbi:MAG TPA: hypothetical protein VI431_00655 [Candidatus Acidoferrum sp.]